MSSARQLKARGLWFVAIAFVALLYLGLLLLYDVWVVRVPMFHWAIEPFAAGLALKVPAIALLAALVVVSGRIAHNYFKTARQLRGRPDHVA